MTTSFQFISEKWPEMGFHNHFRRHWPRYAPWYFSRQHGSRPEPDACRAAFKKAMPRLNTLYNQLIEILPADPDRLASFLSLYNPPAFMTGCSQIAVTKEGATLLIRNYDYPPKRFEATIMRTCVLQPVLFMSDCLWGALDGINRFGLAVSLAFGGGEAIADGFGIPMIVRYLLETCSSVNAALEALKGLPSHMTYNLTLADTTGAAVTVYVGPGVTTQRQAPNPIATNHQEGVTRGAYHRAVNTYNRALFLNNRYRDPRESATGLIRHFLTPPLYQAQGPGGYQTLYTAVYHCQARTLTLYKPGGAYRTFHLDHERIESKLIEL